MHLLAPARREPREQLKALALGALRDPRSAFNSIGLDPLEVRVKVVDDSVRRRIGRDEGLPKVISASQRPAALHAEADRAFAIHLIIPESSVKVLGKIWDGENFAGYFMEELHGGSTAYQFLINSKTDPNAAKSEYVSRFKSMHRAINTIHEHMIGHGDWHERNDISAKLIDPQPYFPSGYAKRLESFLIHRDRQWAIEMAQRIARRIDSTAAELLAL